MASDTSNSDKQNFATQPAPETVVPVVSEQFLVGKRAVPAGGVRVHNRVDQQIEKSIFQLRKSMSTSVET